MLLLIELFSLGVTAEAL